MGFSVVNIRNTLLRRVTLVLLIGPVVILTWFNEVANATWGCLRDAPKAFMAAWRGY